LRKTEIFILLAFFESLFTLVWLLLIPGESGFSLSRLGMLGALCLLAAFFLGLTIKSYTSESWIASIEGKLSELPSNLWWLSVICLSLGFLGAMFFLLQWFFISTDEFLSAYLLRLTPILVLGVIFFAQSLWVGYQYSRLRRAHQDFSVIILGFVTLLPWLLIVEYYWANQLFPQYYVIERYADEYTLILPIALFMAAMYSQVLFFYLRDRRKLRLPGLWIVAFAFAAIGMLFYNAATRHAVDINTDPMHSDQQVYINLAKKVHQSGFAYKGDRNQTPLYPFFQALFYEPEMSDREFFAVGKQVNIVLSLTLLLVLFFVFRYYFSLHRSVILTLIVTFSLCIFKAPYFAVENLYYFLSFLAFLGMGSMLISPSIPKGVLTGIALGFAYYAKASIQPALVLFCLIYISKEIWRIAHLKQAWVSSIQNWVSLFLLVGVFLGVLFPYIRESKNIYGQYFYNQNSTFFIWYDDFSSARADSDRYGYGQGWPDLSPEEIPSLRKYIREHSIKDIVDRFVYGFSVQFHHASKPYNEIDFLLIYLLVLALIAIPNLRAVWGRIVQHRFVLAFVILFLIAYSTLFAWYVPVAAGPRFLYGLFIPFAFSVFQVLRVFDQELDLSVPKLNRTSFYKTVDILVLSLLIANYSVILTSGLPAGYYGS